MARRRGLIVRVVVVAALTAAVSIGAAVRGGASLPTPVDAPAGSATTYQIDAVHDGASSDQFTAPLGQLWSRDFGAGEQVSYPLMVSGRVFVVTSIPGYAYGSNLWALDASDGSVLWGPIALAGTYYLNGIAADGTNVYSVTFGGLLRAFTQSTGALVWSANLPVQWAFTSPPTVRFGTVYVGGAGSGGTLYAVNSATGALRWTAGVANGDHSSPAVTDDGVYVSYACEMSSRYNPATGANMWTHFTGCSGGGGRTPVVHGSSVYVRDDSGLTPVILDTANGAQTGTFSSSVAPAFSAQQGFVMASGNLQAIDPSTGTVQWTQAADGQLVTAPLAIGNDVVVGSATGNVYLLDGATGSTLWSANAGSPILGPDEHNAALLVGLAESNDTLLVPATNRLVAYTSSGQSPPTTTTTIAGGPSTTSTTAPRPLPTPVSVAPARLDFGNQRVGTYGAVQIVTVSNPGTAPVAVTGIGVDGQDPFDFFGATDCMKNLQPRVLAPGDSCRAALFFGPIQRGARHASLVVVDGSGQPPQSVALAGTGTEGYLLAGARGEVASFGDAVDHGDATGVGLSAPIISLSTTPNGAGYWLLGRDGGIFSYGNARFYGSTGGMRLNKPIVAMAAARDGKGYRLVGSDGGIFAFGSARFYGSTGGMHLNQPIDGMAATADGRGYWMVGSDGGIFAFGDAHFYGSAAGAHLTSRAVQITPTPTGHGYWILTGDGHIYAYGDARSYGSAVGQHTIGMAATPDGRGYWEASGDGRIFSFGDATSYGDVGSLGVNDVIGIAATAPPLPPQLVSPGGSRSRAPTRSVAAPAFAPISSRATPDGGRALDNAHR